MARIPQAEIEKAFYAFCKFWIDPKLQSKHEDVLYAEWTSLGPTNQQATFEQIKNIREALKNRGQFESGIDSLEQQLDREPGPSDAERLNLLDTLDDFVTGSHEQAEMALQMLGVLKEDLCEWSQVTPQAILWSLTLWERDMGRKMQSKEDYAGRRAELHALLRITPGRKIEADDTQLVRSLEAEAKKQANRLPTIPPPKISHNFKYIDRHPDFRWELKTFKDNAGGMNEGIVLMCGVNQHGVIVQRAVQKKLKPLEEDDPIDWCGDLEFRRTRPILREYATQVVASRATGSRFILRPLREPATLPGGLWGLYLEYAPHGDLDSVMWGHDERNREVPEPFLWLLFQALIESVLIMKRGVLTGASPAGFREIVHRDWKLGNVILGLPDENHFPQYPRPKVADFGFAIFTDEADDPINPDYWTGYGTEGHFPPECKRYVDSQTRKVIDDWKMLSATNVWGIGVCMYALMTQRALDIGTQPEYAIDSPPAQSPHDREVFGYKFDGQLDFQYTTELRDMVQKCLEFHPDERPTAEDLKEWIGGILNQPGAPLQTMNNGGTWPPAQELLCRPEKERYMNGMHWKPVVSPVEVESPALNIDEQEAEEVEFYDEDMEIDSEDNEDDEGGEDSQQDEDADHVEDVMSDI